MKIMLHENYPACKELKCKVHRGVGVIVKIFIPSGPFSMRMGATPLSVCHVYFQSSGSRCGIVDKPLAL